MDTPIRPSSEHHAGLAEVARTLGHPLRLALLEHLAQGERHVERLAALTGQSTAAASQHLQALRRMGFVQARRNGKHKVYRLGDGPVLILLAALQHYANSTEHGLYQSSGAPSCPGMHLEEFLRTPQRDRPFLLDVRPQDEYALGHVPGAINIPEDELIRRLPELPRCRRLVVYCRGPASPLSARAVQLLCAEGWDVCRLEGGFPQWQAAGLRVDMPSIVSENP